MHQHRYTPLVLLLISLLFHASQSSHSVIQQKLQSHRSLPESCDCTICDACEDLLNCDCSPQCQLSCAQELAGVQQADCEEVEIPVEFLPQEQDPIVENNVISQVLTQGEQAMDQQIDLYEDSQTKLDECAEEETHKRPSKSYKDTAETKEIAPIQSNFPAADIPVIPSILNPSCSNTSQKLVSPEASEIQQPVDIPASPECEQPPVEAPQPPSEIIEEVEDCNSNVTIVYVPVVISQENAQQVNVDTVEELLGQALQQDVVREAGTHTNIIHEEVGEQQEEECPQKLQPVIKLADVLPEETTEECAQPQVNEIPILSDKSRQSPISLQESDDIQESNCTCEDGHCSGEKCGGVVQEHNPEGYTDQVSEECQCDQCGNCGQKKREGGRNNEHKNH